MGCAIPSVMTWSTAWGVATPSWTQNTASLIIGMSTRFETKPAASLTSTGVLPRSSDSWRTVSKVSSDVASPRTTSTSFMTGTGLKKCIPMTLSGRPVDAAIWVIEMDEVLLARIASGGAFSSICSKIWALSAAFSVAASTTRSASATPLARSVSGVSRSRVSRCSSAVIRSLATIRPRFLSMVARAAASRSWSRSTRVTEWPDWANTWAMPLPMVPAPMTVTFML